MAVVVGGEDDRRLERRRAAPARPPSGEASSVDRRADGQVEDRRPGQPGGRRAGPGGVEVEARPAGRRRPRHRAGPGRCPQRETPAGHQLHVTSAISSGGAVDVGDRGVAADDVLGHLQGVPQRRRRLEAHPPHRFRVAADDDHAAEVLEGVGAPVPHVERVDAVVGVALAGTGGCTRGRWRSPPRTWPRSRPGRSSRSAPARRSRGSWGGGRGGTPTAWGGA